MKVEFPAGCKKKKSYPFRMRKWMAVIGSDSGLITGHLLWF